MSVTQRDRAMIVDTGRSDAVWAVAFHPDGMHFLSGNGDGVRRWRISDGQEVGKYTGMNLNAVSVSRDRKWIVCGAQRGASVWDAEKEEMVVEVERRRVVAAVDVSPGSRRFATGTDEVSVWSITTGQRLLGPLDLDNDVRGVRFSPDGRRIATACEHDDVRIFDSLNGDELVTIRTVIPSFYPITPLAWSNDGKRIFATSTDNKVKSFDASTGSQLTESPVLDGGTLESIVLASNGKFIATFLSRSVSFLDASTLTRIGTAVEDSEDIRSIALSARTGHLATGQHRGKVAVRNLASVLPDSYGPFHELGQDDGPPDASPDGLENELPSSTSEPTFNYDERTSPTSSHPNELVTTSRPSDCRSVVPPPEGDPDSAKSSAGTPVRKRWLQAFKKSNKDPKNSVDARFSVIAEGRRERRTVGRSIAKPQRKKPLAKAAVSSGSKSEASSGEQGPADPKAPHIRHASQLLAKVISITHRPESGKATISFTLPAWMLCFRSGAKDGMH